MKVLFINPTTRLIEENQRWRTFITPILPLGIASIAAVLEREGIEVKIIDQVAAKMSNVKLLNEIKYYSPDVVGFSCLTSVITNVRMLIKEIRKFSDVNVVLGNIHPTIFAEELLKEKTADIIIRGEGEITTLELIKSIQKKSSLHGVKGISFREDNSIFHNLDRPLIGDLNKLPYPAWHLFELNYYRESPMLAIGNEPILAISGSRGCVYRCSFCAQDKMYPTLRYRDCEAIIKEMEHMYDRFNVRNFGFMDANFPFSIDFGLKFCNKLIASGLHKKFRWGTETRIDLVNEELLVLMKKAGVHLIAFGFETGNKEIMDSTNKKMSSERAEEIMKTVKRLKIYTLGLFILGLPGETRETCEDTIRFAKRLDCDISKFNIAIPYPGSRFFEEFYNNKNKDCLLEPEKFTPWYDWSDRGGKPVYVPEGMTAAELIGLQRKATFKSYVKPKVLINFLRYKKLSIYKLLYGAYVLSSKYISYLLSNFLAVNTLRIKEKLSWRKLFY